MQFFSQGRIWNTGDSELVATSNWRECHVDTVPDWQRNHYYRTKDGKYFCVTEVKEAPVFSGSLFGAQPRIEFRWEVLKDAEALGWRLQSDLGATPGTTTLIRNLGLAA